MNKISIAQIGVGYWGPNLLRNLVENKHCDVKIAVDLAEERQEYIKQFYPHIKTTRHIEDVFNDESIDAVVIASPADTHFELAKKSLESGKHVLVEKPMCKTVAEVEELEKISQENDLIAMVGHTFIYNAAVRYLKKLIDSGELGDIRYIYCERLNLGRIRSDVDALWNFAPHDISIIQYLLGNPTPLHVEKHGMDYVQQGIDDVVFMNIVYPDKIMAHIHVSWLDPRRVRSMTIVGSKKMVVYNDIAENKIAVYDKGIDRMAVLGKNMDFDKQNFFKLSYRHGDLVLPKIDFEEPLKVEISHFIDCIKNKTSCLTDTKHAKEVINILCQPSRNL